MPRSLKGVTVAWMAPLVLASPLLLHGQGTGDAASRADRPPLVPFRDFGGAVRDFGEDTWLVVSAPARLDRRSGLVVAGVVGAGAVLFAVDEKVRDRLAEDPRGVRTSFRDVGDFFEPVALQSTTNIYFAGLSVLAYFTRQEWLHAPAKQILYSQWINGLIRQSTGFVLGRRRPSQEESAYVFDPGNGKSFPSGHSAVAMSLATVLSHHIGFWPASVALYGAAGSVLFQRLDSGQHWASDVWLGAALGLAVSRIVVRAEEDRRLGADVAPAPGGGVGIRLSLIH